MHFTRLVSNSTLSIVIVKNYQFRRNITQFILGKEYIEYKRNDQSYKWQPFSSFVKEESERILKETEKTINKQILSIIPTWVIEKIAYKQGISSEEYSSNPNYLKILHETTKRFPEKLFTKKEKIAIDAEVGEKCYICLGRRKTFLGLKYSVNPCIVESKTVVNNEVRYNVFVLKINARTHKVEYYGRHSVGDSEIGKTPEQAVHNMAKSHLIY